MHLEKVRVARIASYYIHFYPIQSNAARSVRI